MIQSLVPKFIIKKFKEYQEQKTLEAYKGDKVACPICHSKFKKFEPFGVAKRQNARCINCGSLERHRLLYLYLKNKTSVLDPAVNLRLLHFAPEKCLYNLFTQTKNIEYFAVDINPDYYNDLLKGPVEVQKLDITNITFQDNYFDIIICSHILEHIPDDQMAMSELYRVMKKGGGWGVIQIPIDHNRATTYEDFTIIDPKERVKAFGQYDHVRWYGRDFKEKLKSAGFTIKEENDYIKNFNTKEINLFGLNENIYTIVVNK